MIRSLFARLRKPRPADVVYPERGYADHIARRAIRVCNRRPDLIARYERTHARLKAEVAK